MRPAPSESAGHFASDASTTEMTNMSDAWRPGSLDPASDPDVLARPASSPLGRDEAVARLRAGRRLHLDQVHDSEPVGLQRADPIAVREMELDGVLAGELDRVAREVVLHERLPGARAIRGQARHEQRAAREEDEE